MELKVYDGEYFERGAKWFLIFGFVILLVVVLSILGSNIIGGVFVLLAAGGYIYILTKTKNEIKIVTGKKALQIGKKVFVWDELNGFLLEYHGKSDKNLVILTNKKEPMIYTVKDSDKNLEKFINDLNGHIPVLEKYDQSLFDRFIRKIKL